MDGGVVVVVAVLLFLLFSLAFLDEDFCLLKLNFGCFNLSEEVEEVEEEEEEDLGFCLSSSVLTAALLFDLLLLLLGSDFAFGISE